MATRTALPAGIRWAYDVPVSLRFADAYFNPRDALAECRHVHLAGNGLPRRFRPGFRIAAIGFGSGLSAIAAWQAWQARGLPGALSYTAFEPWPLPAADMLRALVTWPEIAGHALALLEPWARGLREISLPGLRLSVHVGDVRTTLACWDGPPADAWLLEAEALACRRALRDPALMAEIGRRTAPGGTATAASAAGWVQRALIQAGFGVERMPGLRGRRDATRARRPGR